MRISVRGERDRKAGMPCRRGRALWLALPALICLAACGSSSQTGRDGAASDDSGGAFPGDPWRIDPAAPSTARSGPFGVTFEPGAVAQPTTVAVGSAAPLAAPIRNQMFMQVGPVLTLDLPPDAEPTKSLLVTIALPQPITDQYRASGPFVAFTQGGETFFLALDNATLDEASGTAHVEVDPLSWKAARAAFPGVPLRAQVALATPVVQGTSAVRGPGPSPLATKAQDWLGAPDEELCPLSGEVWNAKDERKYGTYRYENGAWAKTPIQSTTAAGCSAVIFVHGVASEPWGAFGMGAATQGLIRGAGCGQALGFYYDWKNPVEENAAALAKFIKEGGFCKVTFVGHSMGTVVTMRAISMLPCSIQVPRAILLAGPLDGTPVASTGRGRATFFLDTVGLVAAPAAAPALQFGLPKTVDHYAVSMQDMKPGSTVNTTAIAGLQERKKCDETEFFTAAGNVANVDGGNTASALGKGTAIASGVDRAHFDGLIPEESARGDVLKKAGLKVTYLGAFPHGHGGFSTQPDVVAKLDEVTAAQPCPDEPPPATSLAVCTGDPHLRTFDGLRYDLQAAGELTLVRDDSDRFEVQVRTRPLVPRNVAMNEAVAARVGDDRVGFYGDASVVRVNGAVVSAAKTTLAGGTLEVAGNRATLVWSDGTQLTVSFRGDHLDLAVNAAERRRGHLVGPLGNFDGNAAGDLARGDGTALGERPTFDDFYGPDQFADSWRVTPATSLFDYEPGKTTADYTLRPFPLGPATIQSLTAAELASAMAACKAAQVSSEWMDACIMDVGATGNPKYADGFVALPAPVTSIDLSPPGLAGPPRLDLVLPEIVVAGHQLIVTGANLARAAGSTDGITVTLTAYGDAGAISVPLAILAASPERLSVGTPPDLFQRLPGAATLEVTTPAGAAHSSTTIHVVESNGFGGNGAGDGFLGAVYQLKPSTARLPNFGDLSSLVAACDDPSVVLNPAMGIRCPFTTLVLPNLDIPSRTFTSGFPGLNTKLVEWFAIRFRGTLAVDLPGTYQFQSCSDDGSNVYVDFPGGAAPDGGAPGLLKVLDNDGLRAMSCAHGSVVFPAAGGYRLVVDYFQGPAAVLGLQVYWMPPGETSFTIIPANRLTLFTP
jgi:pimeloyl-ACP methyl ester carboxylesterase